MQKQYDMVMNNNVVIQVGETFVEYGRLPSGIVRGFEDIVFHFTTHTATSLQQHNAAVKPLIQQLQSKGYGTGPAWELSKSVVTTWNAKNQTTVAEFKANKH